MADLDLKDALNMFKQGVNELAFSRALDGANQQVQQIKASEMNEQQQRVALQQISNNLTMHMAQFGVPATTMEAVHAAIGPKQYKNSNEMNIDGLLLGKPELTGKAEVQQKFEEAPKLDAINLQKQYLGMLKAEQARTANDQKYATLLNGWDKAHDENISRSGNIAKLQANQNDIAHARTLLEGNINNINLGELGQVFNRIYTQGSPTIAGAKEIGYHTADTDYAKVQQYLKGGITTVKVPEYKQFLKDTLDRIDGVNKDLIAESHRGAIRGANAIAKGNPAMFTAHVLSRYGENITDINPKTGEVTLQSDVEKRDLYKQGLEEALKNPNHPAVQSLIEDSKYNPVIKKALARDKNLNKLLSSVKAARKI